MKRRDGTGKQSRSGKRPGAFQMRERLKHSPEKALEEERRNRKTVSERKAPGSVSDA